MLALWPAVATAQEIGPTFQASTPATSRPRRPAVTVDGAGVSTVVWQAHELGTQIFGQRFSPDGTSDTGQ